MKIAISRQQFQDAISSVKDAVGGDNIAIMQNIKMETVDDDTLVLTATNGDIVVTAKVECQVKEQGATAVPARFIAPMVSVLSCPIVEFTSDNTNAEKAVLVGGETKYRIATQNAKVFPISTVVEGAEVKMLQHDLKELFRKTAYAINPANDRKNMNGVNIVAKNGVVTAVGLDGVRVAIVTIAREGTADFAATIPVASVRYLQKILSNGECEARIRATRSALCVETDRWTFQTKLIDDQFPAYERVVPTEDMILGVVPVDRGQLVDALKQISVATGDTMNCVNISFANGVMTLVSKTSDDTTNAKAMIPVKSEVVFEVNMNPRYILDSIQACDSDMINIKLTNRMMVFASCDVNYTAIIQRLSI